jgi:hyperosmotically inducible protein
MILKTLASLLLIGALLLPLASGSKVVDDSILYNNVKRKLANDQVVKGGALDVDVKDGVVTLKGPVEFDNQKTRAEKLVKKMPGVKSVVNQITVRRPGK